MAWPDTERVYTTLKMYSKSFDTMIDEITDSYEEFCKDIDIPNIYKDKDDFKKRYPFDPDNPDSIISNLNRASYFSCVVFLSIVVNYISDSNPYLFVSGLDDTLLSKQNNISDYGRVELNRMLDDGLTFTLSTIRTPALLMEPMRDIRLKLPVITMDGAALFNLKEKRYELVYVISPELSRKLVDFFKKTEEPCFINVVVDDLLMIYYEETSIEIYNTIPNRYDYTIVPGDSNNLIRQIKNRFEPYAWKKS